ncbi:hypothetical protein [Peribacillus sp. RS7]|uniref:hypothetical protein n=1 Tax=Peribacillus sp. RS7 TaxID=3242679 RepID=UPI0035C00CCC
MKGTFYSEKLFTLFLQESLGIYLSVNGAQSLIGEKENGTRITIVKNKSAFAEVFLTSHGSAKFLEGIVGFVVLKVINGILSYSLS